MCRIKAQIARHIVNMARIRNAETGGFIRKMIYLTPLIRRMPEQLEP